jgi:hypothetical protein
MKNINDATEVEKGSHDACADDQSRPWIETVLNTLNQRPEADRQALLKALMHGHKTVAGDGAVSGLTSRPTGIRTKPTRRSGSLARSIAAHPVSGTITPKIIENQSFKPRSRADCRTRVSHNAPSDQSLSLSDGYENDRPNCRGLTCQPSPVFR